MANEQPVIIEELESPKALLVLAARNRPDPGVNVNMRRRSRQVWNPGSDVATTHDMGVAYDPITIKGRFRDDFLRLAGESPQDLVRQAQQICLRGQTCRLTWGDTIVRRGRLKSVEPAYVRADDIVYNFTFEVDAAEELGLYVYRPGPIAATAANIRDDGNKLINAISLATFALSFAFDIATVRRPFRGDTDKVDTAALEELFDGTANPDAVGGDPVPTLPDLGF